MSAEFLAVVKISKNSRMEITTVHNESEGCTCMYTSSIDVKNTDSCNTILLKLHGQGCK